MEGTSTEAPNPANRLNEAAEIRAWRMEKVRRWPRRARVLAVRIFVVGICAVLLLVVLGQVVTFTTTQIVTRSSVPHLKP